MSATVLFLRAYWRQLVAFAIVIALAAWVWHAIHGYGQRQYQAGREAVLAENAAQLAQAIQDADKRAADAAAAGTTMHARLDIALPQIEVSTHDAIAKIRTIYLAAPAGPAAVCERPAGVQDELDAARHRANAAAGRGM